MTQPNATTKTSSRELTITRIFDAPSALVFSSWTQPSRIKQWWGPRGYITKSCELDLHPGGSWLIKSRHTDGSETAEEGVFRETVEPDLLVFTHAWQSVKGVPENETLVNITFVEREGKTTMTFHQTGFNSAESRDGHVDGWSQSFDMLAEHLATT